MRILEHAGELLDKFQADPLTRSRDIDVLKWKIFQKVLPRRHQDPLDDAIFVEIFEIFPTCDLEILRGIGPKLVQELPRML